MAVRVTLSTIKTVHRYMAAKFTKSAYIENPHYSYKGAIALVWHFFGNAQINALVYSYCG